MKDKMTILVIENKDTWYTVRKLMNAEKGDYFLYGEEIDGLLYGEGNNFVRTMLNLGKSKAEISVVADQHGSPTYAEDLANIIGESIEKKIPYGIYHATNEGYTTWYDFTKEILDMQNIKCKVKPVTTEEYIEMMKITQAKRPFNSQMSKQKLAEQGIIVPEWKDGL